MLKKIFIILMFVSLLCIISCKKSAEPAAEPAKTAEEYKAEANKTINEDNMNSELDSVGKAIETEIESQ